VKYHSEFQDFGSRGAELHDIASRKLVKAENPKLILYYFGTSIFRRSEGGEEKEFELWYLELPVRKIALTVGLRGESQSLISLKGDFGKSGIKISGVEGKSCMTPQLPKS
jgi:hypothetical protein